MIKDMIVKLMEEANEEAEHKGWCDTEMSTKEQTKNTETIDDAQGAQVAVAQALGVLKDFYEKAGEATAFTQQSVKHKQPEIFDEPYTGMGGENGGVVGMIEVIQSDFARLESETTAAETEAQKEYDQFKSDTATDK